MPIPEIGFGHRDCAKSSVTRIGIDVFPVKKEEQGLERLVPKRLFNDVVHLGKDEGVEAVVRVPSWSNALFVRVIAESTVDADKGVEISAYYSHDGNDFDTLTDDTEYLPVRKNEKVSKTFLVVVKMPYVKLSFMNLSGAPLTLDAYFVVI